MLLLAELDPAKTGVGPVDRAERLLSCFDAVDVPDRPLGARFSSPVLAAAIASRLGGERVVAHVKVSDMGFDYVKAITKSLMDVGVNKVVYLRGDPQGTISDLNPESVVRALVKYRSKGLKAGLILSARKSVEEMRSRLSASPDFTLILNVDSTRIQPLRQVLGSPGSPPGFVYLILDTPRTSEVMRGRVTSLTMSLSHALRTAEMLSGEGWVGGFVVSAPSDDRAKIEFCRRLRALLGLGG